jgi:UDP-glucose:(heptosyl)LPS alpha-1,3-glucosyltransferase
VELTVVTDCWDPRGGGRERYVAALSREIAARGGRVHLLCLRDRSDADHDGPARLTVFGGPRAIAERRLGETVRSLRTDHPGRPILAARPQPGATHYQLHSGLYREAYTAERLALGAGLRRLLFEPSLHLNRHRTRQLRAEHRLLTPASGTRLMTFSLRLAHHLASRLDIPGHTIRVSRPGVDTGVFCPDDASEGVGTAPTRADLRLLFVGHDFRLKGLATAVRATASCRRAGLDATLTVAGTGSARAYRRLGVREGVGAHVDFLGGVSHQDLAVLYRRAHLLLHPTLFEPYGLVVVEALACGCPVVTTRRCGAAELMSDGVHGFIVDDPENAAAFAAACRQAAEGGAWTAMRAAAIALGATLDGARHADEVLDWLTS